MNNVKPKTVFDRMIEANIEITNLAYENKQMAKFLTLIGLSTDDITDKVINSKSQLDRSMVSKIQRTLKQLENQKLPDTINSQSIIESINNIKGIL